MKILRTIGLLFILLGCFLRVAQAQDIVLSNDRPVAGEEIRFTLQPSDVESQYTAQIYVFHFSGYNADDVELDGANGSFVLPDSATAFLVNMTNEGSKAKTGLTSFVYEEGKPVMGANYAYFLIYDGFGEYFSNIENDGERAFAYLENEFEVYPESKDRWNGTYLRKLTDEAKKAEIRGEMGARVDAVFANPESTEKELREGLTQLEPFGERDILDSLTQLIIERFPGGITETISQFSEFRSETDYGKKAELYEDMMRVKADLSPSAVQFMHGEMAKSAAKAGDTENLESYVNAIANPSTRASTLNSIAWPLAEEGENLELAEKLSRQSMGIIEELQLDTRSSKPATTTLSQWERQLSNYSLPTYMDTYALIRYKQGALHDALAYQRQAVGDYNNADVNERLIQYLTESGSDDGALAAGEQAVQKGKVTAEAKSFLRDIYIKSGKTEQEFDDYYANLEATYLQTLREELVAQLLDEEAPQFDLKNLAGESVTSESMLGKVYVVDFWATWCGPCLASFPAMQTAVNQYANRGDVEFLFVNTWENIPNREDAVAKFIADNDYSFHVLFDTVDEARQFDVVSAYQVSGIPTKFVVDKEGKIRFKAVGYSGSSEEEVHKLTVMIDLASNPPKTSDAGE